MKKSLLLLLILIFSITSVSADIEDTSIIDELEKQEVKNFDFDFKLRTFQSCEGLENVMEKYVKDYWKNNKDKWRYPVMYRTFGTEIDVVMESSDMVKKGISSDAVGTAEVGSDDFSETNVQVAGVDESDIVKTDGKYIYYYNESDKYVYIVEAGDLQIVKKIKLPSNFNRPALYIGKDRLTIISSGYNNTNYSKMGYWINRNAKTYTIIFDTTNIKKPVLAKLYVADGDLRKSRKIGDYIYVISNNSFAIPYHTFKVENDIEIDIKKLLPKKIDISKTNIKDKQNLKLRGKNLPYNITAGNVAKCDDIEYVLPDEETMKKYDFNPSYNIISVINTKNTREEVKTKVIAGSNAELYMSLDNMYLTSNIYQSYDFKCVGGMNCIAPFYSRGTNTLVHKMNIDKNDISYQGSAMVPGAPLTQYSMDEYKGDFRILTRVNNWLGGQNERHTNLYILDKDLNLKGSLKELGSGEDFKSSRYIGDKLFLVTFKQIDPLFVIDVADSANPKVLGELKIPGYSTYLHPYDDNHLIGLGYDTKENQWGGTVNNGVKIDLYEINYDKKIGISSDCDKYTVDQCPVYCEKGKATAEEMCEGNPDLDCIFLVDVTPICKTKTDEAKKAYIEVKQKFSYTLGENGSSSEALSNPRMFMWKAADNKLFLPVSLYTNDKDDQYKRTDFFQGLVTMTIDKDDGIKENFRLTHIDFSGIEEERKKECSKYSSGSNEEKCVKLIDGSEYCEPIKRRYVPRYCYADSTIGEYIASKSWNYRNSFIKRALWIGNNTYSISDDLIRSSNIDTGIKTGSIKLNK